MIQITMMVWSLIQSHTSWSEVKWAAFGSITTKKASGGDGISAELFQILKDDAVKVLHSICKQIWKTQQRHRIEKVRFCSNPKEGQCQECSNYYIIVLISHAHFIARLCSKSIKLGFSSTELRTSKCTRWALKSQKNQKSNCQHSLDHGESKKISEKYLLLLH